MTRFPRRRCALAALLLSTMPIAVLAQAVSPMPTGGLSVAPVQLALSDARRSVSTIVSNPGGAPITVQVRLYGWTMQGEEEAYGPATDIGFSPPVFRLEPHAVQAVRIVAKVPAGPVERSYRLVIDQLPLTDAPGQLQLPVRMVLPVFVEPGTDVLRSPSLEWSARYEPQPGRIVIAVANDGATHVRIVDLAVGDGRTSIQIASGLAGYALAGQRREWSYKAAAGPDMLTITANGGPTTVRVTVPVTRQ